MGCGEAVKIFILKLARNDLKEIREYLMEFGEIPPNKFRKSFEEFCGQVADMPYMFPIYEHNPKYRKAVVIYEYIIFYTVDDIKNNIKIFRILYGKRNSVLLLE